MISNLSKLASALVKIAAPLSHAEKVDKHHETADKDWSMFEKNLKAKRFQQAAIEHPMTDSKLKRYIKNFGGYLTSKNVVGVVPSRTSSKMYKVKELPSGRLGCNCKDWQYVHSVRRSDCDHILELKRGIEKKSYITGLARGVAAARTFEKAQKIKQRGQATKENVRRLYSGEPLLDIGH